MRVKNFLLVAALATVLTQGVSAYAAPAVPSVGVVCSITPLSNQLARVSVLGTFDSSMTTYKINAYSAVITNNGGKKAAGTPYTRLSTPTSIGSLTAYQADVPVSGLPAYQKASFSIYNGSSLKGTATAPCTTQP